MKGALEGPGVCAREPWTHRASGVEGPHAGPSLRTGQASGVSHSASPGRLWRRPWHRTCVSEPPEDGDSPSASAAVL